MIKIELTPTRTVHDGTWVEYTLTCNSIPNHGHLYFPAEVSPALLKDVLEDMVNSAGGDPEDA